MAKFALRTWLLGGTVLVAAAAVSATAWLSVQGTTKSIATQQGEARAKYSQIYDRLIGYAASNTDWSSVQPVLAELQRQTGLRVVVTPIGRPSIESSPAPPKAAPATEASAVIDPLSVDRTFAAAGDAPEDGIDPRVVGPFRLTDSEREKLHQLAENSVSCLQRQAIPAEIVDTPSGRPYVRTKDSGRPVAVVPCLDLGDTRTGSIGFQGTKEVTPTETESIALRQLLVSTYSCVNLADRRNVDQLTIDALGQVVAGPWLDNPMAKQCLTNARREQLRPFVAPTALMLITSPQADPEPRVGLSRAGLAQVAGAAAAVLVLTVAVSMLLANMLTRPVRALTVATRRMRAGDSEARADVRARWEIAELASAFNEMAEHLAKTARQRKEMISDVSHELRTPLSNVRGWLRAAEDGVADVDPELISLLLEETLLLQHIVDDLRDLALADAGELRLEPADVDLGTILRHVAASHGGRPEVVLPEPITLRADPIRLRQAVGNLVSNAVRHTPPDGRITITGRRDGNYVVIEVADTGSGISPEHLPHIFDRFWRAERSRNRRTGGSGLGLAIVRHLVEAHGGEIEVKSTLGVGTVFTMRFPAGDANELS